MDWQNSGTGINSAYFGITWHREEFVSLVKVLFICHGNICRSPMAEMIMKDMVRKRGLDGKYEISSMAATTEEVGHDIYSPARRTLQAHHIPFTKRKAALMTRKDYEEADYVIAMDEENLDDLCRLTQGDPEKKFPAFLTGQEKQEMWRTPGIREILKRPMRISQKAAGRCWRSFPENGCIKRGHEKWVSFLTASFSCHAKNS